ncbi:hypothetical protein ACDQ55_21155 [Chitinophaga sp. 30R24]|uniref:hypothetical protein n=1 Tax=Chitinophaga sp. 30R24 TaxID=3248838 RepID=UPI003B904E59
MIRRFCFVPLGLVLSVPIQAQHHPLTNTAHVSVSPVTSTAMQHALMDSINLKTTITAVKGKVTAGLNDTARQQFYTHIQQTYGDKQLQRVQQGYMLFKDTGRVNKYLDEKLRGFYAFKNDVNIPAFMKRGAFGNQFHGASVVIVTNNAEGALSPVQARASIEDQLVVGNIPFNIQFTDIAGQYPEGLAGFNKGLKNISFDKAAYLERMNKYVNKSFDVNKYFLQDINVSAALKSYISKEIDEAQKELQTLSGNSALKQLISPDELIYLDSSQIKQLFADNRLLQPDVVPVAGKTLDSTAQEMSQRYLDRIYSLKAMLGKELAAKQTMTSQQLVNDKISTNINSVAGQQRNIQSLLPLNFFQRILLQAKQLQAGNIGGEGKGLVKDLFMSGAQGSFLVNNKFLMLGAGTRNDAADIKNVGLNSSIDPGNFATQFLQIGVGDLEEAHTHVGALNANAKQSTTASFDMPRLPKNIFVGAVSEQISLGQYGTIAGELSKSNTTYQNSAVGNDNLLASKAAALSMLNDLWETVSIGLHYDGAVKSLDMSQRAYVSYAGMGYSNPGAPGTTRGTMKYGLNVARKFNKRKLSLGFRADMQDTHTGAMDNSKWKNSQFAVDFSIRAKKRLTFSSHIGQSMMKGVIDSVTQTGYLNRNISVSSQWNGHLFSLPNNSNLVFGLQQINILPVKSLLVNMNLNHSFIINTHVLSLSVLYNKDVKDQALYGNLFTAESAWSYQVWKIINCSSGITYLNNKSVVEQVGIKQTAGAAVSQRFNINLYVDCRKNIVNSHENYLFGNFSTQLALQYHLN